ncbi:hypothetical protein MTR_3g108170 [Medicago truncatula]|uniref:Uncharacterized protein n=1 Tax=Medicago truncatula TaxID=3880 RepID=G7JBR9_MEDTR|nr:hypothetical protein MTR_3g108170 [Medicago truncatula]
MGLTQTYVGPAALGPKSVPFGSGFVKLQDTKVSNSQFMYYLIFVVFAKKAIATDVFKELFTPSPRHAKLFCIKWGSSVYEYGSAGVVVNGDVVIALVVSLRRSLSNFQEKVYLLRSGAYAFMLPLSDGVYSSSVAEIVGCMCQLAVKEIKSLVLRLEANDIEVFNEDIVAIFGFENFDFKKLMEKENGRNTGSSDEIASDRLASKLASDDVIRCILSSGAS